MSETKAHFPFLHLPPELRNEVYHYTLPDETDELLGFDCPTIFKINRQIYLEASRVHYAKKYTIYVYSHGISFLNRFRGYGLDTKETLPLSFPYHKFEALRIHIAKSMFMAAVYPAHDTGLEYSRYCPMFKGTMNHFSSLLRRAVKKEFPLRKLVVDAWSPCAYHGAPKNGSWSFGESLKPEAFSKMHRDICGLFDSLNLNKGTTQTCEIVLGSWAKNCPETIQVAQHWGHAVLCHDSHKGDDKEDAEEPTILFEHKAVVEKGW